MLNDDELDRIAEAYARRRYGEGHGDDYTLIKIAQISDPPGAHFFARYPPAGALIGDGGFFVSRVNGHVTPLGSGDFARARIRWMQLHGPVMEDPPELLQMVMIEKDAVH
jgi:hypothetical protein